MDCFYCLSIWVAAPASLAVARRRRELPVVWLALSGAACLLERATRRAGTALRPRREESSMSCCGKKRKALDPSRPTLASPIGVSAPVGGEGRPAEAARR